MHHENQNFLGRSKHFGPFDGRSLFLKEDRPLRSEKAVVNDWKDVGLMLFHFLEEIFILVPQLVGKFVPHLLLVPVHIHILTAFVPNYRLPHFFYHSLLELLVLYLEVPSALLLEQTVYDEPPELVNSLGVLVELLLIVCNLLDFELPLN